MKQLQPIWKNCKKQTKNINVCLTDWCSIIFVSIKPKTTTTRHFEYSLMQIWKLSVYDFHSENMTSCKYSYNHCSNVCFFSTYIIHKGRIWRHKKFKQDIKVFLLLCVFLRNYSIFSHWEKRVLWFRQSTPLLNTVLPIICILSILNHNLKPEKQQRKQAWDK